MARLKQAFHSSGVCRSMTGAPQIFCVFPEANATETAIPSKQASCLPVLLHSRGLGGAAHCPIAGERPGHGWRTAGPDRQPDRRAPESSEGAVDGQEPPLHPKLYRHLYHGPRPVGRGAGPEAGGRGARLRRLGLAPAGQRHVRPEGEQAPHPQRPPGAGHPQAPPLPQCPGHRRQRRGQNPQLCEAQHSGGQYQLCGHRPEAGGAHRHRRLAEAERVRDPGTQSGQSGAVRRLQPLPLSAGREGRPQAGEQSHPGYHPEGQP